MMVPDGHDGYDHGDSGFFLPRRIIRPRHLLDMGLISKTKKYSYVRKLLTPKIKPKSQMGI